MTEASAAQQPDGDERSDDTELRCLTFEVGIPGFADAKRWVLSDLTDDGIFQQLTCVDDPSLALVVLFPWLAFPDYAPDLPDAELRTLGIESPEDVVLFCAVTIDEENEQLYVNLRAPFVTHARTLAARQLVLDDETLPIRATIATEA